MDAGVNPRASLNWMASSANEMPTKDCPASLALARRPRLRCLTILMKSSTKPTRPRPAIRYSTNSADALGVSSVIALAPP